MQSLHTASQYGGIGGHVLHLGTIIAQTLNEFLGATRGEKLHAFSVQLGQERVQTVLVEYRHQCGTYLFFVCHIIANLPMNCKVNKFITIPVLFPKESFKKITEKFAILVFAPAHTSGHGKTRPCSRAMQQNESGASLRRLEMGLRGTENGVSGAQIGFRPDENGVRKMKTQLAQPASRPTPQ